MQFIIPVRLRALVVNRIVRSAEVFNRWSPTFGPMLDRMHDGEPPPGQSMEDLTPFTYFQGVHLQWELPEALTQGSFAAGDESQFPLIPNRWLLIRYASRPDVTDPAQNAMRGWVVHSDHLESDDPSKPGTSPFVTPSSRVSAPRFDRVGRSQDITDSPWIEPSTGKPPFLTALGPGLPSFAAFEPYHQNVLSFHDTLEGVPTDTNGIPTDHRLSYLVVGWYHDAAIDVVNQVKTIPGLLPPENISNPTIADIFSTLGWVTDPPHFGATADTIYSGRALGVVWEYYGRAPRSRIPIRDRLKTYIGNSTSDILRHGIDSALGDLFLGMMENTDTPGSQADTNRVAFDTGFLPSHAGYRWSIDTRSDDNDTDTPPAVDPVWLNALNQDQAAYDAQHHRTEQLRSRVAALAYLRELPVDRRPDAYGTSFNPRLDEQLAPGRTGSAAQQLEAAINVENSLRTKVPTGEGADLDARAQQYAGDRELDTSRYSLHRYPADEYFCADDPAIAIVGSGYDPAEGPRDDSNPLRCRAHNALVSELHDGTQWIGSRTGYPKPNLTGIRFSLPIENLLKEFDLMHRVSKSPGAIAAIAANPASRVRGPLPEYFDAWEQPWTPMFVSWRLHYFPTPYQTDTTPNWNHQIANNAMNLRWNGTGAVAGDGEGGLDQHTFRGRAYVNPTIGEVTRAQLRRYRHTLDLQENSALDTLDSDLKNADILSQRLSGFNDWLLQRSGAATTATLTDTDYAPDPTRVSTHNRFQPVRSGQIMFIDLRIIDRFGRTSIIVGPNQRGPLHFLPGRTPDVVPNRPLYPDAKDLHRFIQLSPRILTDARAKLITRNTTGSHHGIIGWLLANKLDKSIAIYTAYGHPLGALRSTYSGTISFTPLPFAPYIYTDANFNTHFPDLHSFLRGLIGTPTTHLSGLLDLFEQAERHMVDATEADDDAPASLIGRPYALVTAAAALQLRQPAPTDPSWDTAIAAPEPDLTRTPYTWRAWLGRIGNELTDGLVGYFTSVSANSNTVNYARMYAAAFPQIPTVDYLQNPSTDAITRIGTTTSDASRHLTLLINPHLTVRAHTGVVPAAQLTLNPRAVSYALHHIYAAFPITPLLTTIATPEADTADVTAASTYPGTDSDPIGNLVDGDPDTSYISRDPIGSPAIITITPRFGSMLIDAVIAWDPRFTTDGIRITVSHLDIAGRTTTLVSNYAPGTEPRVIIGSTDLNPLRELTLRIEGQNKYVALSGVKLMTEALAARNILSIYPPNARHGTFHWAAPHESTGERPHWARQALVATDIAPHPDQTPPAAYSGYLLLTPPYPRATGELIAESALVHRSQNPDSIRHHYLGFGTPGALIQVLHTDNQWRTPEEPTGETWVKPDGSFRAANTAYGSGKPIAEIRQTIQGSARIPVSIPYQLETELALTEVKRQSLGSELHSYSYAGTGARGADIEVLTTAGNWMVLSRVDSSGNFIATSANVPTQDRDTHRATLRQRINEVTSAPTMMDYQIRAVISSALVHNNAGTTRFHYRGIGSPYAIIEVLHSDDQWITPDAPNRVTQVTAEGTFEAKDSPYGSTTRTHASIRQIVADVPSEPVTAPYELETVLHFTAAERRPSQDGNLHQYMYAGTGTRGAYVEVLLTTSAWRRLGLVDSNGQFSFIQDDIPSQDRDLYIAATRQGINNIISQTKNIEYSIKQRLTVILAVTYAYANAPMFNYRFKGSSGSIVEIEIEKVAQRLGQIGANGEATINGTNLGSLAPFVRFRQIDEGVPEQWIIAENLLEKPLLITNASISSDGASFGYVGSGTRGAQLYVLGRRNTFFPIGYIDSSGYFNIVSNHGLITTSLIMFQSIGSMESPRVEHRYTNLPSWDPPRDIAAHIFKEGGQVQFNYRGTGIPDAEVEIKLGNDQWSSLRPSGPTIVDSNREFIAENSSINSGTNFAEIRQVIGGKPSDSVTSPYEFETPLELTAVERRPTQDGDLQQYTYEGAGTRGAGVDILLTTLLWRRLGVVDSNKQFRFIQANIPIQDRNLLTATLRQSINLLISPSKTMDYVVQQSLTAILAATYTDSSTPMFDYYLKGTTGAIIEIDEAGRRLAQIGTDGEVIINATALGNLSTRVRFRQIEGGIPQAWITSEYKLKKPLLITKANRSLDEPWFEYAGSGTPGAELWVLGGQDRFHSLGEIDPSGYFNIVSDHGNSGPAAIMFHSIRLIDSPKVDHPYANLPSTDPPKITLADMFMNGGQVRYRYRGTGAANAHVEIKLSDGHWSSLQEGGPTIVGSNQQFIVDNSTISSGSYFAEMRQIVSGIASRSVRFDYTTGGISIEHASAFFNPSFATYLQGGVCPLMTRIEVKGNKLWLDINVSPDRTSWDREFSAPVEEFDLETITIRGFVDGQPTPSLTRPRTRG